MGKYDAIIAAALEYLFGKLRAHNDANPSEEELIIVKTKCGLTTCSKRKGKYNRVIISSSYYDYYQYKLEEYLASEIPVPIEFFYKEHIGVGGI